jgi:lysophospholipase L1-like esterase
VAQPRRARALPVLVVATLAALALGAVTVLRPGADPGSSAVSDVAGGPGGVPIDPAVSPDPTTASVVAPGFLAVDGVACAMPTAQPAPSRRPGAGVLPAPVAAEHPHGYAVVLGDSYSSGWNGVGEGASSWPAIMGRAQDWRVTNLAGPGTGYVNPGWTSQPMRTQVAAAVRLHPGIVIVASGHNDEKFAASTVNKAADVALGRLRAGLPQAMIVVVGPIWPDSDPDPTIIALRDHLRGTAASIEALFIDPIGSGWFTGSNHKYIGSDGTHPTSAGYRRVATLLLASFRADPRLAATPPPVIETQPPTPAPTATPRPPDPMAQPGGVVPCPA